MNVSGWMQKMREELWRRKVKEETEKRARQLVQKGLADGTLPRHIATAFPPVLTSDSMEPCAVCYGIKTNLHYNLPTGPIAFHSQCHAIWKEETAKPAKRA